MLLAADRFWADFPIESPPILLRPVAFDEQDCSHRTHSLREECVCLRIEQPTSAHFLSTACFDIGKHCYQSQVQALQGHA